MAYYELILCRDVYHCTPPELNQIPMETILTHLLFLEEEARDRKRRNSR